MKAALLIALTVVATPALALPLEAQSEPELRQKIEGLVRARMTDPQSAVFEWAPGVAANYHLSKPDGSSPVVGSARCGTVNSKNKFGGYTGAKAFMFVDDGSALGYLEVPQWGGRYSDTDNLIRDAKCSSIKHDPAWAAEQSRKRSAGRP